MKPQSLVDRLALLQLIAAAALLVVFSVATVVLTERALAAQETASLNHAADDLVAALRREWREESDLRRAAAATLQENAPSGFVVEVLANDGRSVLRVPATRQPGPADDVRKIRRHVPEGAWIVVAVSTVPRWHAIRTLAMTLVVVGVPLFLLAAMLSRTAAARMLQPLRRMARQSREASHSGVVSHFGEPKDPLELQQLAEAFNLLLARLDRMLESERRFTQDAAHELRTPLTVIAGELEYALTRLPEGDPSRPGLLSAAQQAHAMTELVEALMFLRRADSDDLAIDRGAAVVNLGDLVREAAEGLLAREPGRRDDLELQLEDEVLASGQGSLLTVAVRNLIANALKFTPTGVAIRITCRAEGDDGHIIVEDGGKGVRPEDTERVFEPYFRDAEARATHAGFGIGLALARRIVRAHRGDITLSRSDLGGARFDVIAPRLRTAR